MTRENIWEFSQKFATEFSQFPIDQQNAIMDFIDVYSEHGLDDFSLFEGKIAPSWSGLSEHEKAYVYATKNHLWHYHLGLPEYTQNHPKYKTSDWVLHFQWFRIENRIVLVDAYHHYTSDGKFYLPLFERLDVTAT